MKYIYSALLVLVISSCGKITAPSIISPSLSNEFQKVDYGSTPDNYQKILKDYLIKNLNNYKSAKLEFINEPAKLTIDHLGETYPGYRVCLSINEQRNGMYIGYRNHFFMLSGNNVSLHLYDSGLLTIPFEYCVTRDTSKEIFIDDIPDNREEIMVEKMDEIKIAKKEQRAYTLGNVYISCRFNDFESTYVFNESNNSFKLIDKLNETIYKVNFNEAFIIASLADIELSINRVTGQATLLNENIRKGSCKLTDRTRF